MTNCDSTNKGIDSLFCSISIKEFVLFTEHFICTEIFLATVFPFLLHRAPVNPDLDQSYRISQVSSPLVERYKRHGSCALRAQRLTSSSTSNFRHHHVVSVAPGLPHTLRAIVGPSLESRFNLRNRLR